MFIIIIIFVCSQVDLDGDAALDQDEFVSFLNVA
jgi:hypothetical protein